MKRYIRILFFNLIILWALAGIIPEITYNSFQTLATSTLILSLLQVLVLPVVKLLFMPIQLLSFGMLRWVPALIILFLFSWLSVGYTISAITIPAIEYQQLRLPAIHLGTITSLMLFGILYSYLNRAFQWILK